MNNYIYFLIASNLIGTFTLIYLNLKNKTNVGLQLKDMFSSLFEKNNSELKSEMSFNRTEFAAGEKRLREELSNMFMGFGESFDRRLIDLTCSQNRQFENLLNKTDDKMDKIRAVLENKLASLQDDNNKKLEAMRTTVDEKLHATLEKRFGESFKIVSDRLEAVHKGLGEMQNLAVGVGDLKKVLNNVKLRGTWGEAQLGNLIEEILTSEQYSINVKTKASSKDNVEFAIKLPGSGTDLTHIWLPIDAKFPLEDYQRLVEASEHGDIILIEELSKSLENRIRLEAKSIRDKYIDPPYTTDFAILFVPIESLYAEVLRIPGLFEQIRRDYRVIIAGPTTAQAILNSLQMGFKTLQIQKQSSEVWSLLGTVKIEFSKFGDLLEKTHKKLQEAGNTIEDAVTKTRTIEKKLDKVHRISTNEANDIEKKRIIKE